MILGMVVKEAKTPKESIISQRIFYDDKLSLDSVMQNLEMYVVSEKLNENCELLIRARFINESDLRNLK